MFTNYAVTAACVAAKQEDMARAQRRVVQREPDARPTRASSRMSPFAAVAAFRYFMAKPAQKQH